MSAVLAAVYNNYLTTYATKGITPYDTHKKSELRSVYNSIVKINKEAPWYLPDNRTETQAYAIDIKENARDLKNTIASLGGLDEGSLLNRKTAYSSNENIVSASFVGSYQDGDTVPTLDIEVKSLATSQENLGLYLPSSKAGLTPGTYSFDIGINGINYEFQFNIKDNETNRNVQDRLVRLINNAGIGLTADVHEAGSVSALRLSSAATGRVDGGNSIFTVSDEQTSKKSGAVAHFGLNYTVKQPSDAVFIMNGEERTASSNNFTVGKLYEISLNGVSADGQTVAIGLKTDLESLTDNVTKLADSYNSFIHSIAAYADRYPKSERLVNEMGHIALLYKNELDSLGLTMQEDNSIKVDTNLLQQSSLDENMAPAFSTIKNFATSLVRKTSQVSLNPMNYVDRTIVAYKNPGHNFASPYTTSAYSGMMFNSYC